MRRYLAAAALALLPAMAEGQVISGAQVSVGAPIMAGAPYSQKLIAAVWFTATAGDIYLVTIDGQFSAYFASCAPACLITYPLAVTSAVYAFGSTAPEVITLPGRPCFPPSTIVVVSPCQGEDISIVEHNYYSKVSRTVLYQADVDGPVTIGWYGWGLSSAAKFGDAVWINPVTVKMQAVKIR